MSPTQDQQDLITYLAQRDAPCPSCDYNLRGLTASTCPECSQHLTLRVGVTELRQRAFIATLVALAMGTGFDGLMALYFALYSFVSGRGGIKASFFTATLPFFLV